MNLFDHFDQVSAESPLAPVMEKGEKLVDHNAALLPYFCLSPEDENTSSSAADIMTSSSQLAFYPTGIDSTNLFSFFDPSTLVLPLTPEDSVASSCGTEQSDDTLLEENDLALDLNFIINTKETVLNQEYCSEAEVMDSMQLSYFQLMHNDGNSLPSTSGPTTQNGFLSDIEIMTPPIVNMTGKQNETNTPSTLNISNLCAQSEVKCGECPVSLNVPTDTNDTVTQIKEQTSVKKGPEGVKRVKQRVETKKEKKARNPLKFPPCVICSGKASGSHYGAITCEACKGFFRRYLQKRIEYKCTKGGKCEIKCCNKGSLNCSGCRLKKCFEVGMSKERSAIGRYTLSKRTEAIVRMNELEGKKMNTTAVEKGDTLVLPVPDDEIDLSDVDPAKEPMKAYVIQNVTNLNRSGSFNESLVSELVEAYDEFKPYGQNIVTKEQIAETHEQHSERYKQKLELFGHMKCIPREEYNEIYEEFGIDLDGRMADMKIECESMDANLETYYNFAKHIPGFYCLPIQDQIKMLKFSMNDFFMVVYIDGYSEEYNTFLTWNGHGYHYEEVAGRDFSRDCYDVMKNTLRRWQALALSKVELTLVAALMLITTDRCKLKNDAAVEKMRVSLTHLLQLHLKKKDQSSAQRRFTKIIDMLVFSRDMSEVVLKENNIHCRDKLMIKEFPFIEEFVLEENDST